MLAGFARARNLPNAGLQRNPIPASSRTARRRLRASPAVGAAAGAPLGPGCPRFGPIGERQNLATRPSVRHPRGMDARQRSSAIPALARGFSPPALALAALALPVLSACSGGENATPEGIISLSAGAAQ